MEVVRREGRRKRGREGGEEKRRKGGKWGGWR